MIDLYPITKRLELLVTVAALGLGIYGIVIGDDLLPALFVAGLFGVVRQWIPLFTVPFWGIIGLVVLVQIGWFGWV